VKREQQTTDRQDQEHPDDDPAARQCLKKHYYMKKLEYSCKAKWQSWFHVYGGFFMKSVFMLVLTAFLSVGCVTTTAVVWKVGEPGPAGGLVFYDMGINWFGWRYLEAAPEDASLGIQWYNGSYVNVKTDTKIGSGMANTEAIIAAQGSGSYAATLCRNLNTGGFSDWFLPSKDELNLLYTVLAKNGVGGFAQNYYYSSSQSYDYVCALSQHFFSGSQDEGAKSDTDHVRAVRAF